MLQQGGLKGKKDNLLLDSLDKEKSTDCRSQRQGKFIVQRRKKIQARSIETSG